MIVHCCQNILTLINPGARTTGHCGLDLIIFGNQASLRKGVPVGELLAAGDIIVLLVGTPHTGGIYLIKKALRHLPVYTLGGFDFARWI